MDAYEPAFSSGVRVPVPVPEGTPAAAEEAARAFAMSVPSEWRFMYEVGQLVRDHFGRPDSGYPQQEQEEQEEQEGANETEKEGGTAARL